MILLLAGQSAVAGAYRISEQCTICQGKRNPGTAASADSPTTMYFNAASLSWLEGTQLDFSVHNIDGEPFSGTPNKNGAESAAVANIGFSHRFNDRWAAGRVATVRYGLVTNYDTRWMGRLHAYLPGRLHAG